MKKIFILLIVSLVLISLNSSAQFGEIRGTVIEQATGKSLPGATVTWSVQGALKGTITNEKGEYVIKPLVPGVYDLEFSYVSFKKQPFKSVTVSAEKATYVDIALVPDNLLPPIDIIWTPPMIDKGNVSTITTYGPEEIENSMQRDVVTMVAQTAGVYQKEEGGSLNIRGSRDNNTLYMVDGIKMTGPFTIPKSAIAEISVLTGGIPAQFGDATGGVIIITTKSYKFK